MKHIPDGYYAKIFYEKKSKTYGVKFPDFPGIITFGHSFDEAVEMAKEALSTSLESDFDRSQPLPATKYKPKSKNSEKLVFIPLEPDIRLAYLIRSWREKAKLSQKQLAQRLGISFQAYQRMERPGHSNLTVATLQRIAQAIKKALIIDVCDDPHVHD